MIGYSPMNPEEIEQILAILNRQKWVRSAAVAADNSHEIRVESTDNQIWRIAQPLYFVRLMYQYNRWRLDFMK